MSLPIIPWLGGKRRLADKLIPLFPPHDCYVEVFCGGAALYFLRPVPAQCEVLNDINGELTNLYRVVQHHLREFIDTFHWALSSRAQFDLFQETPPRILTDIQRAARFYYLRHHAFGGRVAGETYGTATTTPAPNLYRIEENLSRAHLRMAGTNIESLAWDECMRRYDRSHTFFYLDPPYWETEGYGVPFGWEQYEAMATAMASCQGKAMLSINDHPDIRTCFGQFPVLELDIKYSVGNNNGQPSVSQELVFANWPIGEVGGLF